MSEEELWKDEDLFDLGWTPDRRWLAGLLSRLEERGLNAEVARERWLRDVGEREPGDDDDVGADDEDEDGLVPLGTVLAEVSGGTRRNRIAALAARDRH